MVDEDFNKIHWILNDRTMSPETQYYHIVTIINTRERDYIKGQRKVAAGAAFTLGALGAALKFKKPSATKTDVKKKSSPKSKKSSPKTKNRMLKKNK